MSTLNTEIGNPTGARQRVATSDVNDQILHNEQDEGRNDSIPSAGGRERWYKRPSPWWILVIMPLSAMALSGSGPSMLQIYIELVCKSMHPEREGALGSVSWLRDATGRPTSTIPIYLADDDMCSDPAVQSTVSRLAAAIMTTQGVLSVLTGAAWSSLSDRLGRRPILALSSLATIFCYGYFLLVIYFLSNVRGAFWSLIFGTFISGIFGGTALASAISNAYISDCTESDSRSRVFSLTLGMRFIGMAVGPTLCSFIVRTTGTPVAVVIFVVLVHVCILEAVIFIIPESLSEERRLANRRARLELNSQRRAFASDTSGGVFSTCIRRATVYTSHLIHFLSVIAPVSVRLRSGKTHRDWSLTVIAISLVFASVILASNSIMFQFAVMTYNWGAVEIGYWYSGMVAARAATLMLFLPAIIKLYHHYTSTHDKTKHLRSRSDLPNTEESAPLLGPPTDSASATIPDSLPVREAAPPNLPQPTKSMPPHSPFFDLAIAQGSLILEVICYFILPIIVSPTQPGVFVALTILASCGSGFGPSIQALSVELFQRRGGKETGKLFGVMGVVQITSSQIIGPLVYGLSYGKLASSYPQGIFFVSFGAVCLSVIALMFVELPHGKDEEGEGV